MTRQMQGRTQFSQSARSGRITGMNQTMTYLDKSKIPLNFMPGRQITKPLVNSRQKLMQSH